MHADHVQHIMKSATSCRYIIATPITLEALEALGHRVYKPKALPLDYGAKLAFDSMAITFAYAEHVPGTAQVIAETQDGVFAYTSDFKGPGRSTHIIKEPDVLVIDATYGDPKYKREDEESLWQAFVELTRRLLSRGPVIIYAYYGKSQAVMKKLRSLGIEAPFILTHNHWRIYEVLRKYGYEVSEAYSTVAREAREIRRDKWYIEFRSPLSFGNADSSCKEGSHVLLTGRYAKSILRIGPGDRWVVGISGHASFEELMYYVENSRPKLVVVDGYRSSLAARFAKVVEEMLRIKAVAMP